MAEDADLVLDERKRKVKEFLKNSGWIYIIILVAILILTFYIRTVNIPQLKDITTGNYTLGPDLDPFLALRWAKDIVEHGSLMQNDTMRYVPLGYDTNGELVLWPYSIVWIYKLFKFFDPSVTVEYAAIIHPVLFFLLALIFMFFFTRKIFESEGKTRANIIALLSTLIFSILPPLLHRTVAGIPEKEAPGIALMMMSLYFFACMLKAKRIRTSALLGLSAGIATGIAGLMWGGFSFITFGIALAMLGSFFFSKTSKKDIIGYSAWIISFTVILGITTTHYGGLSGLFFSTTSGTAFFVLLLLITDHLLFNTQLKEKLGRIKLPRALISFLIISFILVLFALIFKKELITSMFNDTVASLLNPFAGTRFTLTVAENSRPFFNSWIDNFGASFFWMFVIASVMLAYELVKNMKEKWIVIIVYAVFILALIFSKYSPGSELNGSSLTSQIIFVGGFLVLALMFFWLLMSYHKKNHEFNLDKNYLLLMILFVFGAIAARSAIRLFILLSIPTPIIVGFGAVKLFDYAMQNKDDFMKYVMWAIAGLFVFFLVFSLNKQFPFIGAGVILTFEQRTYYEATYTVPNAYTLQWQQAMAWVRGNTPKEAVFSHWWDYGYWLQSIGERATVLDGGNAIVYWNHLFGRHVLTGENETEALEFLKTHNADYLLIDSTDIGKYPAYSSIGADENYDRYSWIHTFHMDEKSVKETRNETLNTYIVGRDAQGNIVTVQNDADIIWENQIIPEQSAGIIGFIVPIDKQSNEFKQPKIMIAYQQKQIEIPIKCIYVEYMHEKYTFERGLDSCIYIIPKIEDNTLKNLGAAFYISERGMKALWVRLYLFDETESKANETRSFELVHNENDLVVGQLRNNYNLTLPDLIFYQDLRGPIKIWKINYPNYINENPEYLKTEFPNEKLYLPKNI